MQKSGWPKSVWIALPLLTVIALAGCASPSLPPAAPPPAPPPPEAAPPAPPGPPSASSDQDFINLATGMNASESGMGRLAHGKAADKSLRIFAEHMTADHTLANKRLAELASRLKLQVSPPPDQPPPELLTASGPNFDKAYIDLVIKGHQDMISLFESEANNGQDTRAKHFAREMLPTLRHHLREAETLGRGPGV
jgi:putative membrane protein